MLKNKLFENLFFMGLVQMTNMLIPLLSIPVLLRVIGEERFGLVTLAQSFVGYFAVVTEFGYNNTATRDISFNKNNIKRMSVVLSEVLNVRIWLFILSCILISIITIVFPRFSEHKFLFLSSTSIVLGYVIIPTWFFQGIEQMKFITFLNLLSKILFFISIFFVVNEADDYVLVPLLFSLGNIVSGCIAFVLIFFKYELKFKFYSFQRVNKYFKNNFKLALSNFCINSYTSSNILILSIFATDSQIGYYGIADKCINVLRQLNFVVSLATFPRVCEQAKQGFGSLKKFLIQKFSIGFLLMSIIIIVGFYTSSFALNILYKNISKETIFVFNILLLSPIIVFLNIPFFHIMMAYNLQEILIKVTVLGFVFNSILNLILSFYCQEIGTAITVVFTEAFIVLICWVLIKKHRPEFNLL